MKTVSCDVAIIGAGSAGLAARAAATEAGAKTILIESGAGGTTCARCGCMPSKLLLAAAHAADAIPRGRPFGVIAAKPRINGKAVMARVRRERDHFVKTVLDDVARIPARDKVSGHARFASPTLLTVDDHTGIEAKAIIIATGARPALPGDLDSVRERVLTHETVFDLKTLPKSLAVIGAGPLGIEFAAAFARLGVRTTVFDVADSIGGLSDERVSAAVLKTLRQEFDIRLETPFEASRGRNGVKLSWKDGKKARSATFDYVLAATGRHPSIGGLDIQMAGLPLDDKNIPKFDPDTMQCGDSAVFIAGDVNNERPILHEASRQGDLAGSNAARFPNIQRSPQGVPLSVVFTDPDMAQIGVSLKSLKDDGAAGCADDIGRARIDGRPAGILRVYGRRSDTVIVGGEMFGPQVEHLAHLLAWAVQLKMTLEDILRLPFYHPTLEEGLRTALRDLRGQIGQPPSRNDG